MLFGSISYLNLLPFQVFLKRYISSSATKMILHYKRAVPSKINKSLRRREVHAGFISSIESARYKCTNLGIIADKAVYSVLVIKGANQPDPASASSNKLAKVLGLDGKVVIGDDALKYYLDGGEGVDLAREWYDKKKLPFVFARLCFNKHGREIEKLALAFERQNIKIPQYILKKEAKKRDITTKELLWYLKHIHYKMDYRAYKSLKLFLRLSKRV